MSHSTFEFSCVAPSSDQSVPLTIALDKNNHIVKIIPSTTDVNGKPYLVTEKDMHSFESFALIMMDMQLGRITGKQ